MVNFLAHLHDSATSVSTARVYLSALNNSHVEAGLPSPTASEVVTMAIRGFQRSAPPTADRRLPITMDIMRQLKTRIHDSAMHDSDKAAYWCGFTIAFFGYLRVSELAATSNNQRHGLRMRDVSIVQDQLVLSLPHSKTDQFGHGYQVQLPKTGRSVCPVKAFQRYLTVGRKNSEFLLAVSGGALMTRKHIESTLKSLLSDHPLKDRFNTHSVFDETSDASTGGASFLDIR